nr:hypothetical protein [uncultured Psychroserpens sp.]
MTTFEDFKSQWKNQPEHNTPNDGSELIVKKMSALKRKQVIMNIILLITVIILSGFFFYIKAYKNGLVSFALLLMMGSLLIRVLVEYFSIKKIKRIDVTKDAITFNKDMIAYYKKRLRTHYITTPMMIVLYVIGFIILMPFFKENLSSGFYTYISVSAIIILITMVFFIRKQIIKELSILKEINN